MKPTRCAGQQAVSILLLEDLAVVPLLILVAFLAPDHVAASGSGWRALGVALAAVGAAGGGQPLGDQPGVRAAGRLAGA